MRFVVTIALVLAASAFAAPRSVRTQTIDRTVACVTSTNSGASSFEVAAAPAHRALPATQFAPPQPAMTARAGVLSGSALATIGKGYVFLATAASAPGTVFVSAAKCHRIATRLPLTRAGLPGRPTAYATSFNCIFRGPVLIRVRATLEGKTVVRAWMAVRVGRTPVAFAQLKADHSSIWGSSRCKQSS